MKEMKKDDLIISEQQSSERTQKKISSPVKAGQRSLRFIITSTKALEISERISFLKLRIANNCLGVAPSNASN